MLSCANHPILLAPWRSARITNCVNEFTGTAGSHTDAPRYLNDLLQSTIDLIDKAASGVSSRVVSIPTGFVELDSITGGLETGTLTVIGAHPGVGASTLAMDFARSAAIKHSVPTVFVSLDSYPETLVKRMLSAEARIKLSDIRDGRMTDEDWTRLAQRMTGISDAPIGLHRPKDRDITEVTRTVTDEVARSGTKLVIIDSLHLLTARKDLPYENREREVSEVTRRLKMLALDLHIAIVVTVQLSNNPGPRQLPAPATLADLRDSGTIAHVADNVILLHRPDAWERDDPRGGEADIRLLKHRQGPACTITVAHQLHLSRFIDMARG